MHLVFYSWLQEHMHTLVHWLHTSARVTQQIFRVAVAQQSYKVLQIYRSCSTWCFVSRRRMARVFLVRRSKGWYFCTHMSI